MIFPSEKISDFFENSFLFNNSSAAYEGLPKFPVITSSSCLDRSKSINIECLFESMMMLSGFKSLKIKSFK